MSETTMRLQTMREDRGRFAALRGTRVLIYWPHGFGDWVTFGVVPPLLEPSNAYAITRIGDDYVSLMEGNRFVEPLYGGVRAPSDAPSGGVAHLGLSLRACNGKTANVTFPAPLDAAVARFAPRALLWTDYPETEGRSPFPFHTKARHLIGRLVSRERLAAFDLALPLPNGIDFSASEPTQRRVDERLAQFAQPGDRIAVVSRCGVTAARKNWGDGTQARAFAAALRASSPRWRIVSMDDEDLGGGTAGFRALFGEIGEPFGRIYKAFSSRVALFAGVPAGPLHFTMARGGIPTVGLWIAHHPDWYDEPNPAAIHLVGRYVRERKFDRRPATTTKPPSLRHRLVYLETDAIGADDVMEAVRAVT